MDKIYLNTYINTIKSNISFNNSLKQNGIAYLDKNLICELIALYFYINYDKKNTLPQSSKFDYRYIIKEDTITIGNSSYKIEDLINYIIKQQSISTIIKDNTIRFELTSSPSKFINFNEVYKTNQNLIRNHFYIDQIIDNEVSTYINNVNSDFIELTNTLIKRLLIQNNTKGIDEIYIKLIYSLVNNLFSISFNSKTINHNMIINHNEMRVIKDRYQDKKINDLQEECEYLLNRKIHCLNQIYHINNYSLDYSLAYSINKRIEKINGEIETITSELINLKSTPNIFNNFLFTTIKEAIKNRNFEFRENNLDPIITMFTIEESEITGIIEMHLSTFGDLINNEQILNSSDSEINLIKVKKRSTVS